MSVVDANTDGPTTDTIDALEAAFRDLLASEFAETAATPEEQEYLDRVEQKIEQLKALANGQGSTVAIGDIKGESQDVSGGVSKGRAQFGNRLKQMQVELDGLLKDIQNTQVG